MLTDFHLLRPYMAVLFLPLGVLFWYAWRQSLTMQSWQRVCDPALYKHLLKQGDTRLRSRALVIFFVLLCLLVFALTGPAFIRNPVPVYESLKARVVLLSLTEEMLKHDLPPSRLSRAKFKLHDLFMRQDAYPLGLVVFSGEPFVVSPLTADGKTIDALLPALHPNIMPVDGYHLESALEMGETLIHQGGFDSGELLVMTTHSPTRDEMAMARRLRAKGMRISVMPLLARKEPIDLAYQAFAQAGGGAVMVLDDSMKDLNRWLHMTKSTAVLREQQDVGVTLWRDEGRWCLIPALLLCLLFFRRGMLQRLSE